MNTLNKNALSKSILAGALTVAISTAANATTAPQTVGFRTVTDVTVTEQQALSFGTTMFVTAGGVCDMDASIPFAAAMQSDATTALVGTNYGDVSGTGCVDTVGLATTSGNQPGIYKVAGFSGTDVKITINEVIGTDFTFSPSSGCAVDHDGTAAADSDTCTSFFPGTQITVTLANATETGGTEGELHLTVGGKITIGATDLTADTNYSENFDIVATY